MTHSSRASRLIFVPVLLGALSAPPRAALAWGPHAEITRAALAVLPDLERWQRTLGEAHLAALDSHCRMPDNAGEERPEFYIDDYLLIRARPRPVGHIWPSVVEAFEPHFRRSLQALRTETPVNACRQLGPLVHYVEDLGAPPHTSRMPHHRELENWLPARRIHIRGYQARLLGRTDEEALAGLKKRLEELRRFSAQRAERAMPLVKAGESKRPEVEPILLESANESARAVADVLHTVLTLGLAPRPDGAVLEGAVTAPAFWKNDDKGARVILLDQDRFEALKKAERKDGHFHAAATPFTTLAGTAGQQPKSGWRGEFRMHNLPAGRYRVLACRPGANWALSREVELKAGRPCRIEMELPPTEPARNLIQNPSAQMRYLLADQPDRWTHAKPKTPKATGVWTSSRSRLPERGTYVCGARLRDTSARVTFWFTKRDPRGPDKPPAPDRLDLSAGQSEATFEAREHVAVYVTISAAGPAEDAVEYVWVRPSD